MIEGDTLLIELNGSFYFVEASRDVGNFSARPTNTTEPITDPEILAELYTASRGLIFSESLLFPFGESIIDQTNELAVSFDEVRSSSIFDFGSEQSLEIIYESANEFNELLAAVVAGIKGGSAVAANSAVSAYVSLSNFGAEIQSDAYILALAEAALKTAQESALELGQKRFDVFQGGAPVSTLDIKELTTLSMEVVTLIQVVGELTTLFRDEVEPLWTVAVDILRPWAGEALELLNASRSQVLTEVVASWTDTITESALTVLENGPSIAAAEEIFFGISDRIEESVPNFYSDEEIYETAALFGFDGAQQSINLSEQSSDIFFSTSTGFIVQWNPESGQFTNVYDLDRFYTDIAIAPNGKFFGITFDGLYEIDLESSSDNFVGSLSGPLTPFIDSLSGANGFDIGPDGTAIVTSNNNFIVAQVDLTDGSVTNVGLLGQVAKSAGDVIFSEDSLYVATTSSLVELKQSTNGSWVRVGSEFLVANDVFGLASPIDDGRGFTAFAGDSAFDLSVPGSLLGPGLLQQFNIPGGFISGAATGNLVNNTASDSTVSNAVFGGEGNESLEGTSGNDVINGGLGVDTAVYSGIQKSYTLTLSPTFTLIADRRSDGDGSDALIDIELLNFDIGSFDLTQFGGTAGLSEQNFESFIELYIAYFNRAPDAIGLNFWGTAFSNGTALDEMATLFVDQNETLSAYPSGTSNNVFAETVYNNVLGRTPDQLGFDFWVGQLDSGGVSRDQFILEVLRGVQPGTPDESYLDTKVDIGAYFAVHKGMSDTDNAADVMALFGDQGEANINGAVSAIDNFYTAALDPTDGEFLMQLVGVLDDPFAVA